MEPQKQVDQKETSAPTGRRTDVPWYKSCRVLMAAMTAWGYVYVYLLRVDLSMAIVCMTKEYDKQPLYQGNNSTDLWSSQNGTEVWNGDDNGAPGVVSTAMTSEVMSAYESAGNVSAAVCGGVDVQSKNRSRNRGEFVWSKDLKGYMLSSFFYGYIITQVAGGWLAVKYGGKHVFGTALLITIIATILVPVAARAHAYLLIVLRVIMGLASGVVFPATHHMFAQWSPPLERSKLMAFGYSGTSIGTITAMSLSGVLCDVGIDNGWPLIFYVYGGAAFVWWVLWNILVYNSPTQHPRIDPVERQYIVSAIGQTTHEKTGGIPWRAILTSRPVWAIVFAHISKNYGYYTMLTSAPTYMKEVLKFDIKQNGLLSSLPYIIEFLTAMFIGHVADCLRSHNLLRTVTVRKLIQTMSTIAPICSLIILGYLDCTQRHFAVALISVSMFFESLFRAGYMCNHVDISPRYAGVLFGISNTLATIPGMLAPVVAAVLTPNGTREEWQRVFYVSVGFYAFSTIAYLLMASGTEQKWSKSPATPDVIVT